MELDTRRFLSSRLVFDEALPSKLRIANSFGDWCKRIISWICPLSSYTSENQRTIRCFRKYLLDTLGEDRLQKISQRCSLNLDQIEKSGSPLLSRHVAQIVIGAEDVRVEDIPNFERLSAAELHQEIQKLKDPFQGIWKVKPIVGHITGKATEAWARIFHDPFLNNRERLQLCKEHPRILRFGKLVHHLCRVIKRDMDVGTLLLATHRKDRVNQYYTVVEKLVTGEGVVSYTLAPATKDTALDSIRLFRETARRTNEIDASSSLITDVESNLGSTAYRSCLPYEKFMRKTAIVAGRSLGGALAQWHAVNNKHVKGVYSFAAPGIPVSEVNKFNRENRPVDIVIRRTEWDLAARVGGAHLGWQYPGPVDLKVVELQEKLPFNLHVLVAGVDQCKYKTRIITDLKERDRLLYSEKNWVERFRRTLGPFLAATLRLVRKVSRSIFSSRAQQERGLKVGSFQNGKWQVECFRPVRL